MGRYDLEVIKRYNFEIDIILITIALTYIFIKMTGNIEGKQDLGNYFWMPSSIMQSVAAIYALFVAVLVLSIQNNQKIISLVGDLLKPPFKVVSYIVATTIYFNGLVLFIFSFRKPTELQVSMLYFGSLISLFLSLIAIVYFSIWVISTVAGLKTHKELLYKLSQGENIEECYLSLGTDLEKWYLKSEDQKNKAIELYIKLLECEHSKIKLEVAEFLGSIKDTRAVGQLIKNLDDNDVFVRQRSAVALGIIRDERAVEPLINKLDSISPLVRRSSVEALGKIGDVRAVEPIIKKLDDQNEDVNEDVIVSSIEALGKIGDVRAVELLIKKLDDPNENVIVSSIDALGLIGDPRAIEPLAKKLEDNSFNVIGRSQTAIDKIQKRMDK